MTATTTGNSHRASTGSLVQGQQFQQDLFWKNLPTAGKTPPRVKLGFLSSLLSGRGLLARSENVCFIWTGTNRIHKLERQYSSKIQNKLRKKTIEIYLYEPLCFKIDGAYNCGFYSEFDRKSQSQAVVSEELDSVRQFKQLNDLHDVKVYAADYNLSCVKQLYPDIELHCLDVFIRHLGEPKTSSLPNTVLKRWWCANWRYTVHRHLIMSYLVHTEGNYTWNFSCGFDDLEKNPWFDLDRLRSSDPQRFSLIQQGTELLHDRVFSIDVSVDQIKVTDVGHLYIPGETAPPPSPQFYDSYKQCFCAVVTETRFAQPTANISEKTLIAIRSRLPVIVVAPPKTLEYLRALGFKTFNRWWDEGYDSEQDHEQRMLKIFQIIDYLNSRSITELCGIYDQMSEVLQHNCAVARRLPRHHTAL